MADIAVNCLENVASMAPYKYEKSDSGISFHSDTANGLAPDEEPTVTRQATSDHEALHPDQPPGQRNIEVITQVWTKQWIIVAYALIWFASFVNSLHNEASMAWKPYVTSGFKLHGLTPITGLVAQVVSGVAKLPLAKFMDISGRPQGFMVCLVCVVLSLILMATCKNVESYAIAQVFYITGLSGMNYVMDIFITDTSILQIRMIWMTIINSPYVATAFAGPELGQLFIQKSTWRWGYGAFAIITPFAGLPFLVVYYLMIRKTKKANLTVKTEKEGKTLLQRAKYWCAEFDVIGLLLTCSGASLFLLPFSLAAYQTKTWASPLVISMLITGFVLIILLALWEHFGASKLFFPVYLLKNRSVLAACLLALNIMISVFSYKIFYSSYLQVVFRLSIAKAGYITNIAAIVFCVWSILMSILFRYINTFRWSIFIAMPLFILTTGLLVLFRAPGTPIALLALMEVLSGICYAITFTVTSLAIMAAVPQENVATGLALLGMIAAVGGAIGQTISAAIWTNVVPKKITEHLPADKKMEAITIYSSLVTQLAYPWNSPERQAVVRAYGDVQNIMLLVGMGALVPCLVWMFMLKNHRLSGIGERGVP